MHIRPNGRDVVLFALGLGALTLFLFFHRLADRDLWSSHEARAGMDAQSILTGDGPRLFDGRAEVQKPPLYYWLVAGVARLRGGAVDAWAVRLPAALSALLCVAALVALGWSCGRPMAGALAGLVLATAMHFTWLARIGRIDMPLALAVTVAVGAMYLALRRHNPEAQARGPSTPSPRLRVGIVKDPRLRFGIVLLLLAYLAIAAGVLLKGPIGLVLPAAVIAAHLLIEGRWPAIWEGGAWWRLLRELGVWWGAPLIVALTLPVFCWADNLSGGQFCHEFFWAHNVERALGGGRLRSHAWWLYAPYFLNYFLPWSPLLLLALVAGRWRGSPEARFGLAWLLAVLFVLSCARFKRADYMLPAYPGAALFLGFALERWALALGRRWIIAGTVAVALVMVGVWVVRLEHRLPAQEPYRDYRQFAALVRRLAPPPARVDFFRTEAHALAFHVGRPLAVVVDWRELQARLEQPGPHYLIMPPECVAAWPGRLPGANLEVVARNTDLAGGKHERPLVLLRSVGAGVQRTR